MPNKSEALPVASDGPAARRATLRFWTWPARERWFALGLLAAVLLAYIPALRAGFIWDDDDYLLTNRLVQSPSGLGRIWFAPLASPQYYPLVFTTFWVEHAIWGLNPFGYHLVNVLLHAANAILAWRVLERLRVPGALLAGALFALHPVHVESVAWITERKNVLSTLFYLLAAWHFLAFEDAPIAGRRGARDRAWFASLGCFVLALFSKTVAGSLPAALILARLWRRRRVDLSYVGRLVPFFVLAAIAGSVTSYLEFGPGPRSEEYDISLAVRLIIACKALLFYAGKLAWPHPLIFFYPRWSIDPTLPSAWLPVAVMAAIACLLVALWWRRGLRGPFVAVSFFAGTLFPALGFVDVYPFRYSYVADHFQYLASLGLLALGAALATRAAGAISRSSVVASGLVLALLAALSFAQARKYRDLETLWRETLRRNGDAWNVHIELGNFLKDRDEPEEALAHFREASRVAPLRMEGHYNAANTLTELADAAREHSLDLDMVGSRSEAEAERLRAAAMDDEARRLYETALLVDPDHPAAHLNLGLRFRREGRIDESMAQYHAALAADPKYWPARLALGTSLDERGETDAAIEQYRLALKASPRQPAARRELGKLLAKQGRSGEALRILERLVADRPKDTAAREALARVLVQLGHRPDALRVLREGLRVVPGSARLRGALEEMGGSAR